MNDLAVELAGQVGHRRADAAMFAGGYVQNLDPAERCTLHLVVLATDAGGRPIVGVPPRADAVGSEQDDESFEARRGLGDRVAVDEHVEFDRYSRDVERLVQLALAGLPGREGGKHADIVAGPWEIPRVRPMPSQAD